MQNWNEMSLSLKNKFIHSNSYVLNIHMYVESKIITPVIQEEKLLS